MLWGVKWEPWVVERYLKTSGCSGLIEGCQDMSVNYLHPPQCNHLPALVLLVFIFVFHPSFKLFYPTLTSYPFSAVTHVWVCALELHIVIFKGRKEGHLWDSWSTDLDFFRSFFAICSEISLFFSSSPSLLFILLYFSSLLFHLCDLWSVIINHPGRDYRVFLSFSFIYYLFSGIFSSF